MAFHKIHKGTENLIDISKRPNAKELFSKGGKSKSVKKSIAAKQRWIIHHLKHGNELTPDQTKWLMERVRNREVLGADMLVKVERVIDDIDVDKRIPAINCMTQIAKFIHGEKIKTENVNLNITKEMTDEETDKLMDFMEGK